jgi:AraC-like DNA-binding protein
MGMTITPLASGPGWRVGVYDCDAGPRDPVFEERHRDVSISAVLSGSFDYRTQQGRALMTPGSLLLGNPGACFECGHTHGVGDRCLAFHYTPAFFERIVADTPGATRTDFLQPRLPTGASTLRAVALAERAAREPMALEEAALRLAGATLATALGDGMIDARVDAGGRRRIGEVARHLEHACLDAHSLASLSTLAAMSPWHFLRSFRQVVGTTPHQYLLALRMREAARRLLASERTIAAVAADCGFNDLSEFNRRFRRLFGTTPGAWRRAPAPPHA